MISKDEIKKEAVNFAKDEIKDAAEEQVVSFYLGIYSFFGGRLKVYCY